MADIDLNQIYEKLGALGEGQKNVHDQLERLERIWDAKIAGVISSMHERTDRTQNTVLKQDAALEAATARIDEMEKLVNELRGARKLLSLLGVVIGFAAGLVGPLWFKHP